MGNNRTNMKNKLNQIIVTLIIVLSSLTAFGEIIEKQKIIIQNNHNYLLPQGDKQ